MSRSACQGPGPDQSNCEHNLLANQIINLLLRANLARGIDLNLAANESFNGLDRLGSVILRFLLKL